MSKIFTFIFARGGSKGIKNKNITKINNRPLIYYSIKLGKKISGKNVFVSTDSKKIASISKKYGAIIIKRPNSLSGDKSSEIKAWKHAINFLNKKNIFFHTFLSLPTTSPLRNLKDITNVISMLKKCDIVVTGSASKRSPWYNMVKKNNNNYAVPLFINKKKYTRRQDVPKTYDLTTVAYASRPEYILKMKNIYEGKVKLCIIPHSRSLDIDNKFDLKIAKLLLKK